MLKQGHSEKLHYRPRNGKTLGIYLELIQLLTLDDVGRYEHRFPRIGFHFRVNFSELLLACKDWNIEVAQMVKECEFSRKY